MKRLVILICLLFSITSYGSSICIKTQKGEICKTGDEFTKMMNNYDNDMKDSGKWGLVSNTGFLVALVGLGGTYYSINKITKYEKNDKLRENLTEKEREDHKKWSEVFEASVGTAVGGFIIGLTGWVMDVGYEKNAHEHMFSISIDL